ncbi:RES family NAD+ phosphorylase [Legionella feeleii]|uniref:RES domain n=1 Tax=Legionella feeleii TaxID=453 RepID=A0A0W0TH81_9GAMM|nr:RES family NAD+ phosphorylase [Legionella feeleii]KTC94934.1 RES domain protein [Legionella feeleii]SPX62005.1 RES domain [Legionella feeleii]
MPERIRLTTIGGRFNTGVNVNTEVPSFPALYIAKNKDTALQEHLGQVPSDILSPREMALTNPASETIVSISGKFDKVFDLTNEKTLEPFLNLIKKFNLSKELKAKAYQLNEPNPETIKTVKKLLDSLLTFEWRIKPSRYDVPANSQIFGHLVYSSGIEGILYPSKLTKEPCLVIYPKNFVGTDSYIQMDDEPPHIKVPIRIDRSNWRVTELSSDEIIG